MEIRTIKCKSGNEYQIINESWETSRAWGHRSTLLKNNNEIDTHKVKYLNRTWESYTYQTCMLGLIEEIMRANKENYITQYKEDNGITRLARAKRDEIINEWTDRPYIEDLLEIHERIKTKNFD